MKNPLSVPGRMGTPQPPGRTPQAASPCAEGQPPDSADWRASGTSQAKRPRGRQTSTGRVLVAGVGNIFLGDDGFGVEVAKRLAAADLPGWVQVADYGISGMHLAYDLADSYQTAILIDTAQRGEKPGTLTVIEAGRPAGPAARSRKPRCSTPTGCSPTWSSACWTCSAQAPRGYLWSAASRPVSTMEWN